MTDAELKQAAMRALLTLAVTAEEQAWSVTMEDQADAVLAAIRASGRLAPEGDAEAVALSELVDAVAFLNKFEGASLTERIAVGADAADRLYAAARALAAIRTGAAS